PGLLVICVMLIFCLVYFISLFSIHDSVSRLHLRSFPTRRSSDLARAGLLVLLLGQAHVIVLAGGPAGVSAHDRLLPVDAPRDVADRKSTRLNSSHVSISYAVVCLNKIIAILTIHYIVGLTN